MIDVETWDKAIWRGAGFLIGPPVPILFLPFLNEQHAKQIFKDWIKFVSRNDKNDDIRVALIEGDIPNEQKGYYVVVGTNIDEAKKRAEKQGISADELMILNVTRLIRANPTDNFKLFNMFKMEYNNIKAYDLMPGIIDPKTQQFKLLPELSIRKQKLIYRDVKDVRPEDEDGMVLDKNKPVRKYKGTRV